MRVKKFFFIIFLLSSFLIFYLFNRNSPSYLKRLTINKTEILVEIADTPEKREKGLSGRNFLPENQGMVFVFEKADYWSFWMKGMKFPLDFVWIKDSQVVEITENVKPEDFQPPRVLRPKVPVDKVLEINGGMIKKWGIKLGDSIHFNILKY